MSAVTEMRYRPIGDSGLVVSVVGLGCNNLGAPGRATIDVAGSRPVIDAALAAGITLFDTADSYGGPPGRSEEILGKCLTGRRDDAVIATKFGGDLSGRLGPDWGARGSRRYIHRAVDASLRRLRTDWIDLYQYHWPDGVTPVEETLAALDDLVRAGKVRYIGSSNLPAWQVVRAEYEARRTGGTRFVSAQNHYNLLDRGAEAELVPACEAYRIGLLPYFPLASGLLTGKYHRGVTPLAGTRMARMPDRFAQADWDRIEAIGRYAKECGASMLDVAVGGLAAQPTVASVIAGATTAEQVQANARAGQWQPPSTPIP